MTKRFLAVLLASASLTLAGCVSKTIEPMYIPNVAASQNHDGLVTISWPSRTGYNYRLVARDQGKTILDKKVYRGTGQTITVQFMRKSDRPLPNYTVKPEKTGGER